MIPIPVEIETMLAILNLPKEMGDNSIFKEHRTLVLEMVRSVVLPDSYSRAIQEDMPEDDPFCVSFRFGFCFLSGKVAKVSEVELLELISQSEADKELIRIISNQNPDEMDAIEALEYISAFFVYIRANSERFKSWLGSFGLAVKANPTTPTRALK